MTSTYSPVYVDHVDDLTAWFSKRLNLLSPVVYTREERDVGIDALPKHIRGLAKQAFDVWLKERNYELSYQQTCMAMFAAIDGPTKEAS